MGYITDDILAVRTFMVWWDFLDLYLFKTIINNLVLIGQYLRTSKDKL